MATGIPTFRVDLAEGMIDVDSTSADRLFAYCIEADRGPINEPTFVASNREALKTFGSHTFAVQLRVQNQTTKNHTFVVIVIAFINHGVTSCGASDKN